MRFGILGPLLVEGTEGPVDVGGQRQRSVLALLLVHAGKPVDPSRAVDDLWGDKAPATAAATLQSYVSRLRKALGQDVIRTERAGYLLHADPGTVDAAEFEALVAEGRSRLEGGALAEGAKALEQALGLWRGEPLEEFADAPFAPPVIARLSELRLAATEEWAEAQLALGRHAEMAGTLERLCSENPLRERLRAQLMLALYRCGRQADALAAYADLRSTLSEDLGIDPSPSLRELESAILRQDEALGAVAKAAPGRSPLPAPITRFVGRRRELSDLVELLESRRLITVAGPGGAGKTRLALELARSAPGALGERAWFAELAPLTDPDLVPSELALIVCGPGDRPDAESALVDELSRGPSLLVLDNCEHLIGACATIADRLLRRCAELRVVATSRERLDVPGEQVYKIAGLDLSDEGDAVTLFTDRARLVERDFRPDAGVAALCRRVDGLPLAIELAAAQTDMLSPAEIAEKLDELIGSELLPERHRTIRGVVEWSYRLLDRDERTLFERMSVFEGGFTLEACERVCGAGVADPIVRVLSRLLARSLVSALPEGLERRFRLLETMREYARDRVPPSERQSLRDRHAEWYAEFAERVSDGLRGPDQKRWLERADGARDNVRAALAGAEPATAVRIASSMRRYWEMRGDATEARRALARVVEAPLPAELHAKAAIVAGGLAAHQGDNAEARELLEDALASFRSNGDRTGMSRALEALGNVEGRVGNYAPGRARLEEALELAADSSPIARATVLHNLGAMLHMQGDDEESVRRYAEARELFDECGDMIQAAASTMSIGGVQFRAGRLAEARASYEKALEVMRPSGSMPQLAHALGNLAVLENAAGRNAESLERFAEAIAIFRDMGDVGGESAYLVRSATALKDVGRVEDAIRAAEEGIRLAEPVDDRETVALGLNITSLCLASLGRPTDAIRTAERALALRRGLGYTPNVVQTLIELSSFAAQAGDEAGAERWAREARELES